MLRRKAGADQNDLLGTLNFFQYCQKLSNEETGEELRRQQKTYAESIMAGNIRQVQ